MFTFASKELILDAMFYRLGKHKDIPIAIQPSGKEKQLESLWARC